MMSLVRIYEVRKIIKDYPQKDLSEEHSDKDTEKYH